MQQNPLYGENLGNWYLYFSDSMGTFFPSNSYPMVYFIIWEMHGFPHQFSIDWENATKPILWKEPGKLVTILFTECEKLSPIRFPSYVVLHHVGNEWVFPWISHSMAKCNKSHGRGRDLAYGYSHLSQSMVNSLPSNSPSILYHMGNDWVFPSISHSLGKCSKTNTTGGTWDVGIHSIPKVWLILYH